MITMKKTFGLLGLCLAMLSATAFADTITTYTETLVTTSSNGDLGGVNGLTFNATLNADSTTQQFTLDFQAITDNTVSTNSDLYGFTLNLLGGGSNPSISATLNSFLINGTPGALPGTWKELDDAKINNSVNGTSCKSNNGFGGWLCESDNSGTPLVLAGGTTYDFNFSGSYSGTVTTPFDLMADGVINGTHFGVSDTMTAGGSQPPSVPEPGSMLLFGSSLSGGAMLLRKRILRNN